MSSTSIKLPSRYEDLDPAFRGRLRPVPALIDAVQRVRRSISVNGGLRFLPIFGDSGSGKSSAARELGTHLPGARVLELPREAIISFDALKHFMTESLRIYASAEILVAVVDQYEEAVAAKGDLPSQFVEWLSLLDRDREYTARPWLFLWLTTSKDFQRTLEAATSRNRRILPSEGFELRGPTREDWTPIIEETFEAHNSGRALADFGVIPTHIEEKAMTEGTLGAAIERIGDLLADNIPLLQDLSVYQVVMLWPVTDGQRISTVLRFVDAREGYKLDWNAWYRQLNDADRTQLPLTAFNRARLYFDMRLVPIAAADLHPLCDELDDDDFRLQKSYVERFEHTHFVSVLRGTWDPNKYAPLRERESDRAKKAREWYSSITSQPTKLGKRIARVLRELGISSQHEQSIDSQHSTVRADILSERVVGRQTQVITEMKVFAPENTMPSSIRDQVRITLKRHAQLAGFLARQ